MRVRKGFVRLVRWLVIPAMVFSILVQAAPHALADDPRADLNKALDKQKYIQERKQQAQNELDRIYWLAEEAEVALATVESELAAANSELAVITNRLVTAEQELKKVEAELKAAQERYELRKDLLARRVRAINEGGRVNYLAVLLGSNTFADFISRFDMLKLVVKKDSELFAQVREDKLLLEEKQRVAEEHRNSMAVLKARAEEHRTVVIAKRDERQQVSRSLDLRKRELQAQLDEFDRQAELIAEEIYEIQRRLARQGGKFAPIYPTGRPITITDNFGPRLHPILHTWRNHNGTDFAANYGDPVYAIEDGEVIMAGWNDAYGNLIVIDHGGGIASWYGHSSKLLVSVGQQVTQGQRIANAGSTGWSTGPHVHLEVHVNGKPQDPMSYIK